MPRKLSGRIRRDRHGARAGNVSGRSRTSTLLVILLASKPSTMLLYHTTRRGHCYDWSRTSTLLVILLASKPSTMLLYHTTRRGHCYDSAPRLLPAGHCGMPVVMHHTSLYLAQQRR